MTLTQCAMTGAGAVIVLYVLAVCALVVVVRRGDARALGGFIPDSVVLSFTWPAGPR